MKLLNRFFMCLFTFLSISSACICHAAPGSSLKTAGEISDLKLMIGADIKAIVQTQIDSARARDFRGEIKSCVYKENLEANIVHSFQQPELESKSFLIDNLKFFIIVGFSIAVFLGVFIRRSKIENQKSVRKKLKENINLLRTEGSIAKNNPELNQVRTKLVNQSSDVVVSSVSKKAKGMKIGKGEVMLAAKIKSYQLAQFSSNNK